MSLSSRSIIIGYLFYSYIFFYITINVCGLCVCFLFSVTQSTTATGGSYDDDIYRVPTSSDDILSTSATPV